MRDWSELINAIADSGNLSKACRACGVKKSTFLDAVNSDKELADQYARAREAGLDAEADRAIEEALTAEDAALGRLALDARKWYLSKLMPKKYGDKIQQEIEHSGELNHKVTRIELVGISPNDNSAG